MPRKTPADRRVHRRHRPGFNEAAARCRGKLGIGEIPAGAAGGASMRPRPDAAENAAERAAGRAAVPASMRPRPDAAENEELARFRDALQLASMRPRPDAAENVRRDGRVMRTLSPLQ